MRTNPSWRAKLPRHAQRRDLWERWRVRAHTKPNPVQMTATRTASAAKRGSLFVLEWWPTIATRQDIATMRSIMYPLCGPSPALMPPLQRLSCCGLIAWRVGPRAWGRPDEKSAAYRFVSYRGAADVDQLARARLAARTPVRVLTSIRGAKGEPVLRASE